MKLGLLFIFLFVLTIRADDESQDEWTEPIDPEDQCFNENEEMGCLMPEPCWKTCENMNNYVPCEAPCEPGCDCIPGFVRDENGNCIDPNDCPKEETCPAHQEIGCDNPCYPNTCENSYYSGPRKVCTEMCLRQCVCKEGWTFVNNNQYCVPKENCRICCPVNREFRECGPYNPRSCDDPLALEDICEENCNRGCFCRDGLVEDAYGNCIPPEDCPLKCGPNEIEDPCVNPCQPTCDYPDPPVCPFLFCNKGCVCSPPHIRDPVTNECVDRNNCIRHPCLQNETYVAFGYDCKTCSNHQWIDCDPIPQPQCVCMDDFVRDDDTGYCISPTDCPSDIEAF